MNYQANDIQTEQSSNHPQTWLSRGSVWWTLALLFASIDQAIKYAVHSELPYGVSIPLTDFFNFVHRWNTGAAFSFLADAGGWQRYFFMIVAIVVSVILGWMLTKPSLKTEAFGYSLILGGAIGNAIDRINRGYVVDFLDFHWQGWHWPAFNLADIGICVGATLLIVASFGEGRKSH
jgi:signal peptidase II